MDRNSPGFRALLFYGTRLPNHPRKWWVHGKLRQWLQPRANVEMDVIRHGLKWRLNPADFEHETLFWTGLKDLPEIAELRRRIKPGAVFLDIGANFGYYSVRLAAALGGEIEVHAFEPHPDTFARLVGHVERNRLGGSVHPHELALSDVSGPARMAVRADNSGAAHLTAPHAEPADAKVAEGGVAVQAMSLDEFARHRNWARLDCIKIDVEGLEARVLRGGRETIGKFRPAILIEFWTTGLKKAGSSPAELAAVLDELGYRMFGLRSSPLPLLSAPPDSADPVNVLCLHRDLAG